MSVSRNFGRTLSGATDLSIDNIRIGDNVNAIRINGNAGLPNQVIAKNGTTGKLEWDFVESTTIPDNSIENIKLKDKTIENNKIKDGTIIGSLIASDISFSTTGTINANKFTADVIDLPKTGTPTIILDGSDGNITGKTLLMNGDSETDTATFSGNVNINLSAYQNGDLSVAGNYSSLNGNLTLTNGNLSVVGGNTTLYNTTITNSLIADGNGIFTTDIRGSSNANSPYNYSIIGSTGDITTNGNITINTGNDLLINNGGKIDLFTDDGTTRTFDIDGSNGDLKIYNPTNGDERLELDGTSGNILVKRGGRIDMYAPNNSDVNIELNGSNGIIDCIDINVLSHTGTIAFNQIRTNKISLPKSGTATCEIFDTGNIITNGSITGGSIAGTSLSSSTTITATGLVSGGSITTAGNITATGTGAGYIGVGTDGDSYKILLEKDGTITCEDLNVNNHTGTITFNNVNANNVDCTHLDTDRVKTDLLQLPKTGTATCEILSNGNIITNGNITGSSIVGTSLTSSTTITATGNITTAGNLECNEVNATTLDGDTIIFNNTLQQKTATNFNVDSSGNTTIGGTTTFTGDMSSTNGNITLTNGDITLTNGVFRGDVIGDITEEHIHAQSLEIRDNGTGGGNTGIQVKNGYDLEFFSDSGSTKTLDIDGSNGNINIVGNGNIFWSINSNGEIVGRDAGVSSSNDENTTQMRNIRIDESCFKYDTREIAMSKPTARIQRLYSTTSTAWSEINDVLYVKLKTNSMIATNFIVEWSYYAVKDDGSRMWAKLYDVDAASPEDADQPTYLNNTKQVLFDGGSDSPKQHHATFTLRNVSANIDKNIGVCIWTIHNSKSYINFYLGPVIFTGNPPTGGSLSSYAFGGMTLQIKKMYDGGANNATPTGWTGATGTDLMQVSIPEKLMSYSHIDNDTQNYVRIYNTANKFVFNGSQDVGTDTLEVHFTATSTTGYLEYGFYANTLTAGMVFNIGVAVATGGTSPFSTTLTSSPVSIDGYKLGLFNGDTSRYSLKEILDFTSYENTYLTSKFHFHNLTIGTEYKMALYGRCYYSGSIYINAGGKSTTGTATRSAHQPAFLKFYEYDSNLDGARTDDAYVGGGDDY